MLTAAVVAGWTAAGVTGFRFPVPVFAHAATAAMAMMASAAKGDAGTRKLIIETSKLALYE
jgi:hypothetical protein